MKTLTVDQARADLMQAHRNQINFMESMERFENAVRRQESAACVAQHRGTIKNLLDQLARTGR